MEKVTRLRCIQSIAAKHPAIILTVIVLLSILVKLPVILNNNEPVVFGDELIYKEFAFAIFSGVSYHSIHYPPLYSLILAPAFWGGNHFYLIMQITNAVFSSLAAIPLYLLARHFKLRHLPAIGVAVLYLLLPFHLSFPFLLMSENVYVPLFLMTIWLCLKPYSQVRGRAAVQILLVGLFAGLMFMMRYFSMAFAPIFALYLLLKTFYYERETIIFAGGKVKTTLKLLVLYGATFILPTVVWLITDPGLIGRFFEMLLRLIGDSANPVPVYEIEYTLHGFLIWLGLYASYTIWMLLPTLPILLFSLTKLKGDWVNKEYSGGLLLTYALSFVMIILSVRHSFLAYYNYPPPDFTMFPAYILGRYIFYIAPLLILWTFVLVRDAAAVSEWKVWQKIVFVLSAAILLWFSWFFLFSERIQVAWGFLSRFNGAELYIYHHLPERVLPAIVLCGIAALVFLFRRTRPFLLLCMTALLLVNFISLHQIRRTDTVGTGLTKEIFLQLDDTAVFIDLTRDNPFPNWIAMQLRFWDQTAFNPHAPNRFDIHRIDELPADRWDAGRQIYFITNIPLYEDAARNFGNHRVFFTAYPIDANALSPEGHAIYQEISHWRNPPQ